MDEEFIIKLGAETSDFDKKFSEAKRKIDNFANNVVINFDAGTANDSLNYATSAMERFNNQTKESTKDLNFFNEIIKNSRDKLVEMTKTNKAAEKQLEAFDAIRNKFNSAKDKFNSINLTKNMQVKDIRPKLNPKIRSDEEYVKGIWPLMKTPVPFRQDWRIKERLQARAAEMLGNKDYADKLRKGTDKPKKDLSPGEALGQFRGMTKAKTYATFTEMIFGSMADNKARGAILSNVYIEMKEALAKYDEEVRIARSNIAALKEEEEKLTNTATGIWKKYEDSKEFENVEDYKKYLEERKAELPLTKLRLGEKGTNQRINEVSGEMELLNQERIFKLNSGQITRESDEYKELVRQIQEYKKELFELESLKSNNYKSYEKAADFRHLDLRENAKGSGEIVDKDSVKDDYKELAKIDAILKEIAEDYGNVDGKVQSIRDSIKAFSQVAEDAANNIRSLIEDAQRDPDKEGWQSKELKRFNKQWNLNKEEFRKDNPAKKMMNAFSRLGARIKQQTISLFANIFNPIYVVKRAMEQFFKNNIKYANTFATIGYNAFKTIEPLVKRLADWTLKMAQYVNIFAKKWTGVDLFDKSLKEADDLKNKIGKIVLPFDELHPLTENKENLGDDELPDTNPKTVKWLDDLADKLKPIADNFGKWLSDAFEHPIRTFVSLWLLAELTKLVTTVFGKLLVDTIVESLKGALTGSGLFSGLFGSGATGAAGAAGATISNLAGSIAPLQFLTTGALGKAAWDALTPFQKIKVVMGGILDTALAVGGAILTWSSTANLTHNMQELSDFQIGFDKLKQSIGYVIEALGVYKLTHSLVATATVLAGTYLVQLGIEFFTVRNAIDSVDQELKEYEATLDALNSSEDRYLSALQNLKFVEEQYGKSAKDVYDQVEAGKLKVEDMTYEQLALYNAYKQVSEAQDTFVKNTHKSTEELIDVEIAKVKENKENWEDCYAQIKKAYEDGKISFAGYVDSCEELNAELGGNAKKTFQEQLPQTIKDAWNPAHYQSAWQNLTNNFGKWLSNLINYFLNHPIKVVWTIVKDAGIGAVVGGLVGGAIGSLGGPAGTIAGAKIGAGIGAGVGALWENPMDANNWANDQTKRTVGDDYDPKKYNSYAIGTNYVPNDQLALVHKGEAIIPEKYNNVGTQGTDYKPIADGATVQLTQTLNMLNNATDRLISTINNGINVNGEFRQRGSDLYAVVERAKSQRGATILNNPIYAR